MTRQRGGPCGSCQPTGWIVFGSRTLLLFGWLAGFYIVPEGLAAPYAHSLHVSTLTAGLLMAAMPLGTAVGAFPLGRIATPSARMRMMGWLATLSCIPLIGSAWSVLLLWALAGAGVAPTSSRRCLSSRKPRVLRTGAC